MAIQSENERNKAVVDEYFKAGVQGHLTSFAAYLHPDFTVTAPNYLPWGGRHVGAVFNIGVTGTDAIVKIVDHWTQLDGKAISLWAAYFEPQALLEKLGIKLTVDGGMNA
jgi:hypothetical protein